MSGTTCAYIQCRSPYGNDTVDARDGEADAVDCGIGEDVAYVDAVDRVSNCETVTNAPAPGAVTTGSQKPQGSAAQLSLSAVRASLRRGISVRVAAPSAGWLVTSASRGRRVLARRTVGVSRPHTVTVRLRLPARARRALAAGRRPVLKVSVVHIATGGAKTAATTRVRVKR